MSIGRAQHKSELQSFTLSLVLCFKAIRDKNALTHMKAKEKNKNLWVWVGSAWVVFIVVEKALNQLIAREHLELGYRYDLMFGLPTMLAFTWVAIVRENLEL